MAGRRSVGVALGAPVANSSMWQSTYVPSFLSPDWMAVLWAAGAALVWIVGRSRYRACDPSFARGLALLVALQSLVALLGLTLGDWQRRHAGNPTDTYVACTVVLGLLCLGAIAAGVRALRVTSPVPDRERSSWRISRV